MGLAHNIRMGAAPVTMPLVGPDELEALAAVLVAVQVRVAPRRRRRET